MLQLDLSTTSKADGLVLRGYGWLPEGSGDADAVECQSPPCTAGMLGRAPRAVVQIAHGMAEHAGRYARFARALNTAGFAVYGFDHRGHGRTGAPDRLGHMGARDGWAHAISDLGQLVGEAAARHPGLPVFLFAHSMGSFMAQRLVQLPGPKLAGCVLCGSNGKPPPIAAAGRLIARLERWRKGGRATSALIDALSFGAFNKPFQPARTAYDWLSRDPAEVDRYVQDPFCGISMDIQFWVDFLDGLTLLSLPQEQQKVPKDLPFMVIAGKQDPVSHGAKGLQQLLDAYRDAGIRRVDPVFYEGARHELLNETNRDAVTADVIRFLESCL